MALYFIFGNGLAELPADEPREDILAAMTQSWRNVRNSLFRRQLFDAADCLEHAVPVHATGGLLTVYVPAPYGVPEEHRETLSEAIYSITGIRLEVEYTNELPASLQQVA